MSPQIDSRSTLGCSVTAALSAVSFLILSAGPSTANPSVQYLGVVLDRYHRSVFVYEDSDSAGNHFVARGRMCSDHCAVPAMVEDDVSAPHSGRSSIRAEFKGRGVDWGGWYFMNGVLEGSERKPTQNWGTYPDAGFDLRGATVLTFWAKGARGGEQVEFFAFGVGRDATTGDPIEGYPYPDGSHRVTTGFRTLTTNWTQISIPLVGLDLSYVLGGFGWVTNAGRNSDTDIAFYLDDIQYDKSRLDEPRFPLSYETVASGQPFDLVMRNVSFTYDASVTLLALLAGGRHDSARRIADALVYAQDHDRYYEPGGAHDGLLRNGYQAGDLVLFPGWTPNGKSGTVRMPGWSDPSTGEWYEDMFVVSTHTGNMAWAALALMAYYEASHEPVYLQAAVRIGEWIERHCRDTRGEGGYTGGFQGWEPSPPENLPPQKLLYKSTEHNLDSYVVFRRLARLTGDAARWDPRAEHAKRFLVSIWDAATGHFWTGTGVDGVTTNPQPVPLDCQTWALLALWGLGEEQPYLGAVDYFEEHHAVGAGFDFDEDGDGIWWEGTGQAGTAYAMLGRRTEWQAVRQALAAATLPSGALPAASKDGLTTGFLLPDGSPWLYYARAHVGATAWRVFADTGFNPFWPNQSAPSGFFTLTPCRAVDTRGPAGTYGGPKLVCGLSARVFPLSGQCGIPATARALSVNATVTEPTVAGNLRLYPAGPPQPPGISTINYVSGLTRANNAVVALNGSGELAAYCSAGAVHFILDVNGYFE